MTEAEWLTCNDPDRLLAFLARPPDNRTIRLFVAAACRRVEVMASHPAVSEAITLAEAMAEGPVPPELRETASKVAFAVWREFRRPNSVRAAAGAAARAVGDDEHYPQGVTEWVRVAVSHRAAEGAPRGSRKAAKEALRAVAKGAESRVLVELLRDVAGNPFRPIILSPSWLTPTVQSLAQGIYTDRAFDRLLILADALQDAGCADSDLLDHCRSEGPHTRGCWAIDLLLKKE